MAKMSTDELLDQFREMTLLELSEFVKKFEETFDVEAAAPAPAAPAATTEQAAPVEEEEEQTAFDIILNDPGEKKIQVIKEVRGLASLGLKEAKEMVDDTPQTLLEGVSKEQADKARDALEGAGASITVK